MYLSLAYEDLKNIEYIDFSGSKRIFAQDLYLQFTKNFPKLKTLILKGTRPSFHNISDEEWKDMSEEEKVIKSWNGTSCKKQNKSESGPSLHPGVPDSLCPVAGVFF